MPLTSGSLSARVWRVLDPLPPNFAEMFERNLSRHGFRPIDPEKGELQSIGWVNIRQPLDSRLTMEKVLVRNHILLGLRLDKLSINQRIFRATLAQEIAKAVREKKRDSLSSEERLVLEDKVRLDLIKRTQPATTIHEVAWKLESGQVWFTASSQRLAGIFSDLFAETFQVTIEPQLPFLRARAWAERQGCARELLELLPAPFSPRVPADVVEVLPGEEE
jgi:hypothetical protein